MRVSDVVTPPEEVTTLSPVGVFGNEGGRAERSARGTSSATGRSSDFSRTNVSPSGVGLDYYRVSPRESGLHLSSSDTRFGRTAF